MRIPSPRAKAVLDPVAAASVRAVIGVARLLPVGGRALLADLAGDVVYLCLPRRRSLALSNLERAFPERSVAERAALARASFRHFARVFFEVFPLGEEELHRVARAMPIDGLDHLSRALAAGRGAFYLTAHLGNWELMAHALALSGHSLAVLVRRTKNRSLDGLLDGMRTRTGNSVIDKDEAVPRMREVLKKGGIVGILMDQNVLGSKAAFVDFFGQKAATTPVAALLALRHRASVLCGFTDREGFGRYRVRIVPAWEPDGVGDVPRLPRGKAGVEKMTQELTRRIEDEIRRAPGTWLWSHDRFRTRERSPVRRIAVRLPNWLGDAVMAEPALRAIANGLPDVELWLLARAPVALLFASCGYRVLTSRDAAFGERVADADVPRFRAALVLGNSLRAALGARRIGARLRIGFAGPARGLLLSHVLPPPPKLGIHQVDRYLMLADGLAHALGGTLPSRGPEDAVPRLRLVEDERLRAGLLSRFPELGRPYAVLAPGAAYGSAKRWDAEGWSAVGRRLLEDGEVIVVGSAAERELGRDVATGAGSAAKSIAGETTLPELAACLASARVVVCNDSGTMHLAAALGARTVGLFGATDPAATGPRSASATVVRGEAPCSPCRYRECPVGRICWSHITPERVLEAVAPAAASAMPVMKSPSL